VLGVLLKAQRFSFSLEPLNQHSEKIDAQRRIVNTAKEGGVFPLFYHSLLR